MEEDMSVLVSGIEYKARKLIEELKQEKAEKERLGKKNELLLEEIENQKEKINQLNKRTEILKVAKSLESTKDKAETKKKLSSLMREIDRCITLLNK